MATYPHGQKRSSKRLQTFYEQPFIPKKKPYYQLYECNSPKIPLKNELAYIESLRNWKAFDKIEGVAQHEIKIQSYKIQVSRNYKKEVLPKILGDNLWNSNR